MGLTLLLDLTINHQLSKAQCNSLGISPIDSATKSCEQTRSKAPCNGNVVHKQLMGSNSIAHAGHISIFQNSSCCWKGFLLPCFSTHLYPPNSLPASATHLLKSHGSSSPGSVAPSGQLDVVLGSPSASQMMHLHISARTEAAEPTSPSRDSPAAAPPHTLVLRGRTVRATAKEIYLLIANQLHLSFLACKQVNLALLLH